MRTVSPELPSAAAAADRICAMMDREPKVVERAEAIELPRQPKVIEFRDVHFSYPGRPPLLKGITLTVHHGETIALVGPNGCGKTTLMNLLPRFWDVDEGSITIDGHDVRDLRIRGFRRQIGIVPQETILFQDTIAANIAYGDPGASRDRIIEAAKRAYAHQFVMTLPEGYDTVIGERGHGLSGGQRQRIALARTMLRDPSILILDEATSAVDIQDEALIRKDIEEFSQGRTTFLISHSLGTIQFADRIVLMDDGCIVASGTDHELNAPPHSTAACTRSITTAKRPEWPVASDQWPVKAGRGVVGGVARTKSGVIGWAASPSAPSSVSGGQGPILGLCPPTRSGNRSLAPSGDVDDPRKGKRFEMDGTPKREYHAPTVGVDRVVITEGIEVRPGVPLTIVTERDPVDPISRDLASGVYSPQYDRLLGLLQTIVPVGGRVLDLGAHIGTFSLAAAALGYEVLAVEASPQNAALLQASIEANGFRQMRVIHAAVSDRSGVLEFCAIGPWGHVSTPLLTTPTVRVPAVTVEQILDDHGWDRVDFVKIDIEGSEVAALEGMKQLLSGPDSPPCSSSPMGTRSTSSIRPPIP